MTKKLLRLGLCVCLCLPLFSCKKPQDSGGSTEPPQANDTKALVPNDYDGNPDFTAMVEEYTLDLFAPDDFALNYYFNNPADYGIQQELYTLWYMDRKAWDTLMQSSQDYYDRLLSFDTNTLSSKQLVTYNVLKNTLEAELALKDFYYLDNAYLGTYLKFQATLPIYLEEFTFNNTWDIEAYFHMLQQAKEILPKYAELEAERQKQGVGLGQNLLDEIIEQCEGVANASDYYLLKNFENKLAELDFLSESEKQELIKRHQTYIVDYFQKGYAQLAAALREIDASAMTDVPLSEKPGGQDYYNALLLANVGISMNGQELDAYLDAWMDKAVTELRALKQQYGDEYLYYWSAEMTDAKDATELYDYLYTAIAKDYPVIEKSLIDVKKIDDANADNTSPAMYFTSKIDAGASDPERILVNGYFSSYDYQTYAHEGYPGHLYQTVYVKTLDLPILHQVLGGYGYVEGWATYAEQQALDYAIMSEKDRSGMYWDNIYYYIVVCKADVLVNYYGYSRQELAQYVYSTYGPFMDANMLYDICTEEPTNVLYYYVAFLRFIDLRERMESALGADFTLKEFHQFILDRPAYTFDQLDAELEVYLKNRN